jgi:hypothetical protein
MAWFVGSQLKSKDSQQRIEAVARLAHSRTPQSIGAVFAALGDPAAEVRLQALRVTVGWRDENTLRALTHVLRDPEATIREQAIPL